MSRIQSVPEESLALSNALDRLFLRTAHGIRPGLEIELALLEALGNPQTHMGTIHVAGTNGKGTVCSMIERVLRERGVRTGIYTSPHLVRFHERFRVGGDCISNEALTELIEKLERVAGRMEAKRNCRPATFFEISTALALEYFRGKHVDIAILETGMGGLWDATNVTTPLVTVITRIDMDHMNYLGDSREKIAKEKAGIIKRGRPVICGPMATDVREIVLGKAAEMEAPVIQVEERVSIRRIEQNTSGQKIKIETADAQYGPLILPLIGRHQLENCALAVAALEALDGVIKLGLTPDNFEQGLARVEWPARCQVLETEPLTILDGAHNPCGARSLVAVLDELSKGRPVGLIVSFLADKDCVGFMRIVAPRVKRCWAVTVESDRAMSMEKIVGGIRAAGLDVTESTLEKARREARAWAEANSGIVCIAGSLYLAGEVLKSEGYT